MNTLQITKVLSNNRLTRSSFRGVYAADMIPKRVYNKPASYVINTDPSYHPGTHWVAVHFPVRGAAEFFDSFGRAPFDKRFTKFLLNNSKTYIYNAVELQDRTSLMCGKYCCLYILGRCSGNTMKTFVNHFIKNMPKVNDRIANLSFNKLFIKKKKKNTKRKTG